ncbi:ribonuclease H-like domain-containing protein [Tanacetum coccineum]|uniref:Ribonuclease H-like domain-containing protein n=1 Tax=Tanacetum coccineum TaxID=301880 RepID=A0ABQ5JAW0_9ASTR
MAVEDNKGPCTTIQFPLVAQQSPQQVYYYTLPSPQQHPGQGLLGPALAHYTPQATSFPSAFSTMTLQDPTWHMDTGASSHLNFNASNLSTIFDKCLFPSVHAGDGNSISVTNTGHNIIPSLHRPLHLHNVLVTLNIIKNLIFVHQFTRYNNCTIEFDAFGFYVKDFMTRHILLRCDSSGDLYLVTKPSTSPTAFLSTSASTWHQRLSHPGDEVLRSLVSHSIVEHCFDIIHSDLWTSPIWRNAMYDEYNALAKNGTWLLVPKPAGVNMVRSMWLFKHKFHANGTLSRYKARLVANSSSQQLGIDFDETFSPVVKPATIRTILSLVVSRKWPIHQLDVKNTFLNVDLSETVYMHQPPGFVDARQGSQFDMTDLGALNYFLGISAVRHSTGLFLSQRKYAIQLLERAHMVNCNPSRTPVDTEFKLGLDRVPVQDPTLYRSLAGGLQYLTFTRLDLSYVGTLDLGLHLYVSSTTSQVGYTDADWAGCPSTRRSTLGYCVFLGDNLLSWSAKRQHTLSRSCAEAEYRGVANVVAETAWLCNLLRELHSPLSTATLVYCDNVSAVYMSANPVQHQWTKHIEIDIHFVRDMVTAGDDPERWIFAITEYFSLLNIPADQHLQIMGFNLEGVAAEWFRWMSRNGLITTWDRFVESVKNRFGPSKYEDPQGTLLKLLQLGTIEDYQREFEMLMNRVTGILDSLLISFYISGLKLHLQRELLASKPLTLGYVFLLARMIEARLEDNRSTTTIAKPNDLVLVQHLEETTFHKSNKVEETEARVEATMHKEKATIEKEETIKETADTLTSLQSEVASLEAKGSVDANEKIKKDHTLVHELEKQVEKLPMELQLKNNVRGL